MYFILFIIAALGAWVLIKYPDLLAVAFFTMTIADINLTIGGFPLNMRAFLGLALFGRTVMFLGDFKGSKFFQSGVSMIVLFLIYSLLTTEFNDIITFDFIKTTALSFITVFIAYHYYFQKGSTLLRLSIILSGLICFADLAYTYIEFGEFPVQRVYQALLGIEPELDETGIIMERINHGFYGCMTGMAFVIILNDFINKDLWHRYMLGLLPILGLGVVLSTSRSAILSILCVSGFLIIRQSIQEKSTGKLFRMIFYGAGIVTLVLMTFSFVSDYFEMDTAFLDYISLRLVDEPIAVFQKNMGMNYNASSLDALDWREEASSDAWNAFLSLKFIEQMFGIGYWGFVVRDLGHTNLPPHNGLLTLLIEYGMIGFVFYVILSYWLVRNCLRLNPKFPTLVVALVFLYIYCLGQNQQLTESITFVFLATIIAENEVLRTSAEQKVYSLKEKLSMLKFQ